MSSEIFWSDNPIEWQQLEGVYVNEVPEPAYVHDTDLSVIGMAGVTVRGPAGPRAIGDFQRFVEVYGGRTIISGGPTFSQMWLALATLTWGTVVVNRVIASDAVTATKNLLDTATPVVRVDASSPGDWGNDLKVAVEAATDGDATHFNVRIDYKGKQVLYQNLDVSAGHDNLASVVGSDEGNLVVLTKLADSSSVDVAALASLTTGDDGTVAQADYAAAVTELASYAGVAAVLVPEAPTAIATMNGTYQSLAAEVNDRIFLTWSGVFGQTPSEEIADWTAQITTPDDRVAWIYNELQVINPETQELEDLGPHLMVASILSQQAPWINPGADRTRKQTQRARSVKNKSISRGDGKLLRASGIAFFEKQRRGILLRDAIMTDGSQINVRRQKDEIILSVADFLVPFVKDKNTLEVRGLMRGATGAYLEEKKKQEIMVKDFKTGTIATEKERGQGIEKLLLAVRLIPDILFLVLVSAIGTTVTVEEVPGTSS